ncbi:MAG: ribonuclease HII [Betaproteobacteria bacterium]|nr:ribonuclease HII [Betaproteobacteria bacterium]
MIGLVAGVDEAGRGPLAGPVCAACVILDARRPIAGLADSKVLTARRRAELAAEIRAHAIAWEVAFADVAEIDRINILHATLAAMRKAVLGLGVRPAEVLVDGNRCPELPYPSRAVVRGDSTVPAISAASILAKTARDAVMDDLDRLHPEYGFVRHKGYPTVEHLAALRRHGPTPHHRLSFAPVRAAAGDRFPPPLQKEVV